MDLGLPRLGGAFGRLGLADGLDSYAELKEKEIENGRLAVPSILGQYVQAMVTGEGPTKNWASRSADTHPL